MSVLSNFISGTQDPTTTPTYGLQGQLYVRLGVAGVNVYQKQDGGTTTNWSPVGGGQVNNVPGREDNSLSINVLPTDYMVVSTNAASATFNLPTPVQGMTFVLKATAAGSSIDGTGELIDGNPTAGIAPWVAYTVSYIDTQWYIMY